MVSATILTVVALLALIGCAPSRSAGLAAPGPSVGEQLDGPAPTAVSDAVLVTSTGQRLSLDSLRGKVVVVSDMMTLCQETCPLDTANVVAAARSVQAAGLGNHVEFLSVTIDPQRDTVSRLIAFRKLYAPAPADWAVATGTGSALSELWKALGVYIQKVPDTAPAPRDWLTGAPLTYDLTHSDDIFFFDSHGRERFLLQGSPHVAAGAPIPPTLARFMDADGRKNLTDPDPVAWTLPQELQVVSWLADHRIPPAP
jgi:protein SCO1